MQNLNYTQAQNLYQAINSTEIVEIDGKQFNKVVLKPGRHLGSETINSYNHVQKKLRDLFTWIQEKEKSLFEDNDYMLQGGQWVPPPIDDKDKEEVKKQRDLAKVLNKKLDAIRKGDGKYPRSESRGRAKKVVKEIPLEDAEEDTVVQIPNAFIRKSEFIELTKECSGSASSILAEFLLEGFEK